MRFRGSVYDIEWESCDQAAKDLHPLPPLFIFFFFPSNDRNSRAATDKA